jgi:hypothetical protein
MGRCWTIGAVIGCIVAFFIAYYINIIYLPHSYMLQSLVAMSIGSLLSSLGGLLGDIIGGN